MTFNTRSYKNANETDISFLQCTEGTAVFRMIEKLIGGPQYVMITGPILSSIAAPTATVSHHWNITQVCGIYNLNTFILMSDSLTHTQFVITYYHSRPSLWDSTNVGLVDCGPFCLNGLTVGMDALKCLVLSALKASVYQSSDSAKMAK